jgi:DNA-binding GntR family transcriptional regulator
VGRDTSSAYEGIRELIRAGAFHGGQPLREASLAERLGVSRTPVREALRRLAAEGIVELRPNRGARLVEINPSDVDEIFTLRALLEPHAASRAATFVSASALERLAELVELMDQAVATGEPALDELAEYNREFHRTIVEEAGSHLLADALAVVVREPLVQRTFHSYSDEQQRRSQQHHRELVAALAAGNADWASAVMRSHIEAARSVFT